MIRICHAVCDENGNAYGGKAGDQTGKEIRVQKWYDRPWDAVIVPKDPVMADAAAEFCERIAESPLYGYNQKARTAGYKAIIKSGYDVEHSDGGDFDCSSLVSACYIFAGSKVGICYTGSLERVFRQSGEFDIYHDSEHLHNPDLGTRGTLYLSTGHHVCMQLDDGSAEQTAFVKVKGSVRVRETPVSGKTIGIARNELLRLIRVDASGWYEVEFNGNTGFITNNLKYTEFILK